MPENPESYQEKFNNLLINDYGKLEERLNKYISNAIGRIDYFYNLKRIYFEINLTLMVAFSTIFPFIFTIIWGDSLCFINSFFFGLIGYLFFTLINVFWYFYRNKTKFPKENIEEKPEIKVKEGGTNNSRKERKIQQIIKNISVKRDNRKQIKEMYKIQKLKKELKTKKFWDTLWFYEKKVPERKFYTNKEIMGMYLYCFSKYFILKSNNPKIETKYKKNNAEMENNNIMKYRLLKDDIKELFKLYCYQSSYSSIAIWTRRITLWGIIFFISFLILGFFYLLLKICVIDLIINLIFS